MLASAGGKTFHSKTFHTKNNFNHIHALHFKVKVFQLSTWQSRRVDTVRASLVAQTVGSLGWKIPWRRAWQPTPVFLPGESHGLRSLAGYSPWCCKEWDMTEQLSTTQHRYSKHKKKNRRKGRLYIDCVFQEGGVWIRCRNEIFLALHLPERWSFKLSFKSTREVRSCCAALGAQSSSLC